MDMRAVGAPAWASAAAPANSMLLQAPVTSARRPSSLREGAWEFHVLFLSCQAEPATVARWPSSGKLCCGAIRLGPFQTVGTLGCTDAATYGQLPTKQRIPHLARAAPFLHIAYNLPQ